jgi:oxygen-independent coproporphyrinogen-3 oxidase
MSGAPARDSLALYVHWPFCLAKCPYCDFNSHVRERIDQGRWRDALVRELGHYAAETPGRRLGSIFFGGGTPSLMAPATVAAVIGAARAAWTLTPDIEITLEANPTSVEAGRFAGFREAGVNRVSLGVQALDDGALAALGRQHSVREALAAVAIAARTFGRYSFDLIYARPGQTVDAWRGELRAALGHVRDHLSVYQLTAEPETPFARAVATGKAVLPDEELGAALYEATQEMLGAAGLPAYEISNHAAPGAESRHNLAYWLSTDYAGVGPGAHGRLSLAGKTYATEQVRRPEDWLAAVEKAGHATLRREPIASDDRITEALLIGLRLTGGIPRAAFARATGRTFEQALDPDRLGRLVDGGFIILDLAGLRATADGRQRLNAVLAALID